MEQNDLDILFRRWEGNALSISEDEQFERKWTRPFGVLCVLSLTENLGFWTLADEGKPSDEIQRLLGIQPKLYDCIVAVLADVGLVTMAPDGLLIPSAFARRAFVEKKISPSLRPTLHFFEFVRHHLGSMEKLARGEESLLPMGWPPRSESEVELFEPFMTATSALAVSWLDHLVTFSKHRRLLDVGCGDGNMAAALCRKHAGLHAVLLNLPQTRQIVERTLRSSRVESRVCFSPFDLTSDTFPEGFDAILFSRMLSDWPDNVVQVLLSEAARTLEPEGRIYVLDTAVRETVGEIHPWSIFWEVFVPGFALNGPRDASAIDKLARVSGLAVVREEYCSLPPLENLMFLEIARSQQR